MFGWDDAAMLGFVAGEYIYHRYIDPPTVPPPPPPAKSLGIPKTASGTPYPIIYGRVRVRTPLLAWVGIGKESAGSGIGYANAAYIYGLDQLLILGIGWPSGSHQLLHMWAGEVQLADAPPGLSALNGAGGTAANGTCVVGNSSGLTGDAGLFNGRVEFLDGRTTQQLVNGAGTALTFAGQRMLDKGDAAATITGFRNVLSVGLVGTDSALNNPSGYVFWFGSSPQVPIFSFEVQSLPPGPFLGPNQQVSTIDGDTTYQNGDCNPVDVLYDILCNQITKLGLSTLRIDNASFIAAAATLDAEGNGFSRCWDQTVTGRSIIDEIMKQIDGVLYEDPATGTIKLKLIRPDFTVTALPFINPANCEALQNFAAGGWTGVPNKIRVNYQNRGDNYQPASATAQNQANAVGQDGEVIEVSLDMPGVCEQSTARAIAARELAARSRPLMKCSAIVDRTFYAVCPGDPVRISWPEYGLSDVVFRVAAVNRGTLADGRIKLDLIQDYSYVWRQTLITPPEVVKPTRSAGGATLAIRY